MKKSCAALLVTFLLVSRAFSADNKKDIDTLRMAEAFQPMYGLALQGDVKSGLEIMKKIPEASLTPLEKQYQKDFLDRFGKNPEPFTDPTTPKIYNDLVTLYQGYWFSVAMGQSKVEAADALLRDNLERLLLGEVKPSQPKPIDQLKELAKARLLTYGIKSWFAQVTPLEDFMAWKDESHTTYKTQLIDSVYNTNVVFMENFLSMGWTPYLTLGLFYNGGWATENTLNCVKQTYDLDSELFKVNYLKHETQHLADLNKYPDLVGAVLEYRAKLAELAFSRQPSVEFGMFSRSAVDKSPSSHTQANYWVMRDMNRRAFGKSTKLGTSAEELKKLPVAKINQLARELQLEDSSLRKKKIRKSGYS